MFDLSGGKRRWRGMSGREEMHVSAVIRLKRRLINCFAVLLLPFGEDVIYPAVQTPEMFVVWSGGEVIHFGVRQSRIICAEGEILISGNGSVRSVVNVFVWMLTDACRLNEIAQLISRAFHDQPINFSISRRQIIGLGRLKEVSQPIR